VYVLWVVVVERKKGFERGSEDLKWESDFGFGRRERVYERWLRRTRGGNIA
jgi:hypothetical protein